MRVFDDVATEYARHYDELEYARERFDEQCNRELTAFAAVVKNSAGDDHVVHRESRDRNRTELYLRGRFEECKVKYRKRTPGSECGLRMEFTSSHNGDSSGLSVVIELFFRVYGPHARRVCTEVPAEIVASVEGFEGPISFRRDGIRSYVPLVQLSHADQELTSANLAEQSRNAVEAYKAIEGWLAGRYVAFLEGGT
jgi:hypothetical protein